MKRLREDIYRCRFLLPCALAAMLILRWAVMRGRPERMVELPLGPMVQWIGIAEGKAVTFGVGSNNSDLVVHSTALEGGATRLVVRHPSEQSDVGAFVAGGYVYYTNVWYRSGSEEAGKSRNPRSSLGLEMNPGMPLSAMPRKPGEPARPAVLGLLSYGARGRIADRLRTTLHRVPIRGGAPEEVDLDPGRKSPVFSNLSVVGDSIFWTRRRGLTTAEAADFTRDNKGPAITPSHQELWVTRAKGGSATLLYSGNFQFARLMPTTQGVFWRVVRPGSPTSPGGRDLVYVSADSLKLTVRPNAIFDPAGPPVICGGKVYWINDPTGIGVEAGASDFGGRTDLLCANPDGSDMRVVINLSSGSQAGYRLSRLFAYQGRMYATLWEQRASGNDSMFLHYLCSVDPDRDPVIVRLTRLPRRLAERGVFDEGYYYFLVNEPRDNLLNWSTEENQRPDRYFLYRWKLPDEKTSEGTRT